MPTCRTRVVSKIRFPHLRMQMAISLLSPVSLMSVVCKIMEAFLKSSIFYHLNSTLSLSSTQHGFVPKRPCQTNLLVMEEWVTRIIDDRETADNVFLDFAKKFDSVDHRFLFTKLQAYGINGEIVSWITAFLGNTSFRVLVNGCRSEVTAAESGAQATITITTR